MKSMVMRLLLILLLLIAILPVDLMAQPGGGGRPCPKPPCPPAVPISGIEILLAGGAALGLKKVLSNRRRRN